MLKTTPEPAEAVADRLHSVAIHLLRQLRQEDLSLGLGPTQLSALSVLVFGGPQTIGALARIEQVAAPTISRLVDALVAAGLAARETDAKDRRVVHVSATPAGSSLMQRGRRQRVQRLVRLLEDLDPAELETVGSAAERLAQLLRRPRAAGE
ncbi:MarR family winged helix-turn-helix transcriptional regulator [Nevskia soli]|uniref:MarR family winged helix-turn-helix transcriptional regulator n=1 Tax=Nevskia soli TaxID=418856 RepID=UPI0004A6D77A|nr:MarR family transcriptional regulator [Nevskia soli]